MMPKKNVKVRVFVDYRKLNVATVTDAFPLPFVDGVLDAVVGHEIYNFLDGFTGYNQIRMHPDDQEKTSFVTKWGVFVAVLMMFGLKTAPTTLQRVIMEKFTDYVPTFMQVFLDDFTSHAKACARHPFFGVCLLTFFDGRPHSFLCGCLHFICD